MSILLEKIAQIGYASSHKDLRAAKRNKLRALKAKRNTALGVAGIAGAGLLAAGAKKLYDAKKEK